MGFLIWALAANAAVPVEDLYWARVPPPPELRMQAVAAHDQDLLALTKDGSLWRWDRESWHKMDGPSPRTDQATGLSVGLDGSIWAWRSDPGWPASESGSEILR